ncbi:hypothetical protein SELMODRAFT_135885 [Selaginella moellendorffii]|uniref:Pentacotripeptide-repeat region of PRORP domain-containing protein n=2 Tax=Selaginella moellendorffii TaxID=88036 RepID=D8TAW0_SELML|nr:hypothetical protein SELMODRAFT_135885 [Selaginella moellendorffii]
MKERSIVSWTAMLCAYAQNGHLEDARQVFDAMPERDVVSYNAMLAAYTQRGHMDEASQVFFGMEERSSVSWNCIACGYAQDGHIDAATRVFLAMPELSVVSWTVMLCAYAHTGQWTDALDLFSSMKMTTMPDDVAFLCVLLACNHAGSVRSGCSHFFSMAPDYNVTPRKQHYSLMLDLLSRGGYLDDAGELVANMPFAPDARDWTSLLGSGKTGKEDYGARAARGVLELDPHKDGTYVLLANYLQH